MKLLNEITIKGNLLGLDWSRPQVHVYDPRTDKVTTYKNIEEVASNHPGCSLVLEATAESFELERRNIVLAALAAANIDAYTFKTRITAEFRREHNISEKSDTIDAKVIYRVATETKKSLKRFGPLMEKDKLREDISKWVISDRSQYDGKNSRFVVEKYFGKIASKKHNKKLESKADLSALFEDKNTINSSVIPMEFQGFIFGSDNKYRKSLGRVFHTAEEVRKVGGGYRVFRRQIGNYSNGYGCIMRSEVNFWLVRTVANARIAALRKAGQLVDEKKIKKEVFKESKKFFDYIWKLTAAIQCENEADILVNNASN